MHDRRPVADFARTEVCLCIIQLPGAGFLMEVARHPPEASQLETFGSLRAHIIHLALNDWSRDATSASTA
jgi:hypothetical protein